MLEQIKRGAQLAKIGWNLRKTGENYSEAERALAKRHLVNLFAQSKGITMKVGQLFADDSVDNPYNQLVDSIEPLPLNTVIPEVEKALGGNIEQFFSIFKAAEHAASLGQVHYAELHDGTPVAVKVQYPDIQKAVDAELKLAGLLPGAGPVKKWGFDLSSYIDTLRANMERELDYLSEARRQQEYYQKVKVAGLVVPKVYMELCRKTILVQSWETGDKLEMITHWTIDDRLETGRILLKTLLASLFEAGLVHGDPHSGNYLFRKDKNGVPEVVLLDYGCTIPVDRTERLSLLKLIVATRSSKDISALSAFVSMGFELDKLAKIAKSLPMLARILFRPFLAEDRFRVVDWNLKKDFESLLGERRWWFRSAGPSNLFLLLRAFQGLTGQLGSLQAYIPWWKLLYEAVSLDTFAAAGQMCLPELASEFTEGTEINSIATTLHVKVLKNGVSKASVELPAELVLDLKNIIPPKPKAKIKNAFGFTRNIVLIISKNETGSFLKS